MTLWMRSKGNGPPRFKRAWVWAAVAVLAAISWPAYNLGVALDFWQPFSRPRGVSARARYFSTMKTAEWFDCSVDAVHDVDVCSAWDDSGRLIARGRYRLDGENRAAKGAELRPERVQLYPGRPDLAWIDLYGKDPFPSKILVPVDQAGRPLERFEVHTQ